MVHCARIIPEVHAGPGGAVVTNSDAVAVFPVVCVPMKSAPLVLLYVPAVGAVTATLIEHVPSAPTVPLEKEIEPDPAVGEKVGVPQPEVENVAGDATSMLAGVVGKVSVKLTPLMGKLYGLLMVKVSVETPPVVVTAGVKLFAKSSVVGSMIAPPRVVEP